MAKISKKLLIKWNFELPVFELTVLDLYLSSHFLIMFLSGNTAWIYQCCQQAWQTYPCDKLLLSRRWTENRHQSKLLLHQSAGRPWFWYEGPKCDTSIGIIKLIKPFFHSRIWCRGTASKFWGPKLTASGLEKWILDSDLSCFEIFFHAVHDIFHKNTNA